jgi:hypothetical protein
VFLGCIGVQLFSIYNFCYIKCYCAYEIFIIIIIIIIIEFGPALFSRDIPFD